MQDCFRKYPEIYGSEMADDEEGEASAPAQDAALAKDASEALPQAQPAASTPVSEPESVTPTTAETPVAEKVKEGEAEKVKEEVKKAVKEAVPVKAHDATGSNKTKK